MSMKQTANQEWLKALKLQILPQVVYFLQQDHTSQTSPKQYSNIRAHGDILSHTTTVCSTSQKLVHYEDIAIINYRPITHTCQLFYRVKDHGYLHVFIDYLLWVRMERKIKKQQTKQKIFRFQS